MIAPMGLTVLRIVLALVIGWYSLALVVAQFRGHTHHALVLLGIAELVSAILFLIPRTIWLGGVMLIVVFTLAALFHLLHGEYSSIGNLAVYAAAAWAVVSARSRT